jgi:4-diphosphocytidyl-2-C-methyl-D-erythritol kinase
MTGTEDGLAAPIAVEAPAKINLYLHVVARRPDGYHLLDSLMVFAGVGDTVTVTPADALELVIDGPFAGDLPAGDDNLVVHAARLLQQTAGVSDGARVRLTKRLPVASGIGGGSADAAACLKALVRLWRVDIADEALSRLGLRIGADVPVCLAGRPAFVGGIGERLEPAPALPPAWLVLANPGVAVPTAAVFGRRQGPYSPPSRFDMAPASVEALAALIRARGNDLTEPAVGLAPVIGEVLAALRALTGSLVARMSGSGATGFGLFADKAAAESAASDLRRQQPSWWVVAAPVAGTGQAG